MERSISSSRPATSFPTTDLTLPAVQAAGKLTWRTVLAWLREDKILSAEDVDRTAHRFAGGNSAQHPLVRIGSAGLTRVGDGKVLDTETLTEWLAKRSKLPYVRIDPLKVDVGRVADVMSINYAERRHALPLNFGLNDVTIATCEPLDIGLGLGDRVAHQAARPPGDRQPDRDRPLHDRVLRALALGAQRHQDGRELGARQLRAAGRARQELEAARRQRLRRHPGRRLALAVRLRPARLGHPPRAAARAQRHPLPHRRRDAHRLPAAAGRDERDDRPRQAARADGRGREAPSARRPDQGPQPGRRRGRDAPVDHSHRVRREDGDADLRSRHHRQDAREPGLRQPRRQALGRAGVAGRTASSWSPAPPARARRPRSTRPCGAWPPTRSTSARSRTRSR